MENLFTFIKWKLPESIILINKKNPRNKKTNYNTPGFDINAELRCFIEGLTIVCVFAYFFYRSYWAIFILSPGIWFYRKEKMKKIGRKRKCFLEQQFKESLQSIQTNLQSGYSMENAFAESYSYIVSVYGKSSDMARELDGIKKGLANGDNLEHLLWDIGRRCSGSSLEEFANIYSIACKTGSGWTDVIMKIIAGINQRMELKQEIETLIHGKKQESRIMCMIPFLILLYMDMTSKGYFDVLYHNVVGIVIMSVCLIAYVFAFLMAEKITEI